MTVDPDLRDTLRDALGPRRAARWRAPAIAAVALACGIAGGLLWADDRNDRRDLDYALSRAISLASYCKGIPAGTFRLRIEERVGKPLSQFGYNDTLRGLDYAFDRLQVSTCLSRAE